MRLLLRLYYRMPVFCQNTAISLYGLFLYVTRYRGVYKKYLKLFAGRSHTNPHREKNIQNRRFLKLLRYAAANSPFYREFYRDIPLQEIESVEDITRLPILDKDTLRQNLSRIYTVAGSRSLPFYTGGTGGTPLKVRKRLKDVQQRMAYLDAYKLSFGFRSNKMKSARFFGRKIVADHPGRPVFWRTNYPLRQRLYSTYHLTGENLPFYVKDLNRYKPQAIDGFVSAIYAVAKYMEDNHITASFTPKAVFTTSETVLPLHRETIERVFGCPLSDQYASNEGAPFIIQCPCGSYHEAIDTGIFEHIPTAEGTKLLVTGFDTFGTPLIRYDIGDMILEGEGAACACQSAHPVIKGILGREADFLMTEKGSFSQVQLSVLVSGLSDSIAQMQFRQKKDGSFTILCVPIRKEKEERDKRAIHSRIEEFFGDGTKFRLEFTDCIERAPSGKYRLIVRE